MLLFLVYCSLSCHDLFSVYRLHQFPVTWSCLQAASVSCDMKLFTGCVSFLWNEAVYRLHQFPVTWSCLQAVSVFCDMKLFTGCVSFLWNEAVYRLRQFSVICGFSLAVSCDMWFLSGCCQGDGVLVCNWWILSFEWWQDQLSKNVTCTWVLINYLHIPTD